MPDRIALAQTASLFALLEHDDASEVGTISGRTLLHAAVANVLALRIAATA